MFFPNHYMAKQILLNTQKLATKTMNKSIFAYQEGEFHINFIEIMKD